MIKIKKPLKQITELSDLEISSFIRVREHYSKQLASFGKGRVYCIPPVRGPN
jgi:hypothetical protein